MPGGRSFRYAGAARIRIEGVRKRQSLPLFHGRIGEPAHEAVYSQTGSSTFSRYNKYDASASMSYRPSLIPAVTVP